MKLMKKMVAGIAMAAMCCAMVVPTITNAAGACPGHNYVRVYDSEQILSAEYDTHTYKNEQGQTIVCRIQWVRKYYDHVCLECGDVIDKAASEDYYPHMSPNCPIEQ